MSSNVTAHYLIVILQAILVEEFSTNHKLLNYEKYFQEKGNV